MIDLAIGSILQVADLESPPSSGLPWWLVIAGLACVLLSVVVGGGIAFLLFLISGKQKASEKL
jgi:hypothetical protein